MPLSAIAIVVDQLRQLSRRHPDVGVDVQDGFHSFAVRVRDAAGRRHVARVSLPLAFPEQAPEVRAEVPAPLKVRWHRGASLLDVVEQFQHELGRYQDAWAVLDDLDAHAWVLEPESAARTRAVMVRRVALGASSSLQLEVTPARARAVCDVRFVGADREVGPLREKWRGRRRLWNSDALLRANLEEVLDISLPKPVAQDDSAGIAVECGICYVYRLGGGESEGAPVGLGGGGGGSGAGAGVGGALPDVVCDNSKCGRPFHRACLVQWLRSDTSTRTSYSTLYGKCPYCSSPLEVDSRGGM